MLLRKKCRFLWHNRSVINCPISNLCNFGIILQSDLSVMDQICIASRNCYYNIRQRHIIRASLSHQAVRDIAYALILSNLSRLDYSKVLYVRTLVLQIPFYAPSAPHFNSAARVVPVRSHFSPITGYVHNVLHWLPATHRIEFKMVTFAFRALNWLASSYLIDLAVPYALASHRTGLQSSSEIRLAIPRHNNKFTKHASAVACPSTWNKLPLAVRESFPYHMSAAIKDVSFGGCISVRILLFLFI